MQTGLLLMCMWTMLGMKTTWLGCIKFFTVLLNLVCTYFIEDFYLCQSRKLAHDVYERVCACMCYVCMHLSVHVCMCVFVCACVCMCALIKFRSQSSPGFEECVWKYSFLLYVRMSLMFWWNSAMNLVWSVLERFFLVLQSHCSL